MYVRTIQQYRTTRCSTSTHHKIGVATASTYGSVRNKLASNHEEVSQKRLLLGVCLVSCYSTLLFVFAIRIILRVRTTVIRIVPRDNHNTVYQKTHTQ